MKRSFILSAALLLSSAVFSQTIGVGVNADGSSPDPSSILDVKSTDKGFLVPRMTAAQRAAISSPATGLLVYQTDPTAGFYFYNGSAWVQGIGPAGATGATGATGPAGADGKTVLNGTTNPTTQGTDGDFYINTNTNTLFGPKASGSWPAGISLVGPAGATGATGATGPQGPAGATGATGAAGANGKTVLNGTSNPTAGIGVDGDFYINTTNRTLFGPKASGAWPAGVSLVGPTGATGATGATGSQGPQGIQGPAGFLLNGSSAGNTPYWNGSSWVTSSSNLFNNGGNVGIGTTSPAVPLHVSGGAWQTNTYIHYGTGNACNGCWTGVWGNIAGYYAIQSDNLIRATGFNAVSDSRIKTNVVKQNTANQLSILNKLSVVNYSYIDKLVNGSKTKTGFIAQQVEAVNSEFVNQSTDFIPSVFAMAKTATIENDILTVTTEKSHGFEKGDEVKLFAEGKKETILTIEDVKSPNSFAVKGWTAPTTNLFVYGKKVSDFRAIDFDQINALSVAAIQELSKQVDVLKAENAELKKNMVHTEDFNMLKAEIELLKDALLRADNK